MGSLAAVAVLAPVLAVASAPERIAAQDPGERRDCRCVDRDGNEIEGCTCFRTPRLEMAMPGLAMFGDHRARLGVSVDVREDAEGAVVADVLEGGPADEAGIREGDVITHLDGRSLSEPIGAEAERDFDLDGSMPAQRLLALARDLEPGERVEIGYLRDGARQTTVVEAEDLSRAWGRGFDVRVLERDRDALRERLRGLDENARAWRFRYQPGGDFLVRPDESGDVRVFEAPRGGFFRSGALGSGLELVALNPSLGGYFGVEEGVLVTDVAEDVELGLEPGDVVLAIGDRPVSTPERFRRILASYGEDEDVELRIVRDGTETTVRGRRRD